MGLGRKQDLSPGKAKDRRHKGFSSLQQTKSRRGKEEATKTPAKEEAGDLNIHLARADWTCHTRGTGTAAKQHFEQPLPI